mmetsp:Transcript_60048/g.106870  ORF Transcript_60048/g.106870 Transcript_60048/m.106870 type:complete len:342 (+) Transcript_60048:151-1176(+)
MAGEIPGDHMSEAQMPVFFEEDWTSGAEVVPEMRLLGDFYRETDAVTRGVTLFPGDAEEVDPFRDIDGAWSPLGKGQEAKLSGFVHDSDGFAAEAAKDSTALAQFTDAVQAPVVDGDRFHASATSLLLQAVSAAEVATSIQKLLLQESGEIIKVRPAKFSLKADIFQEVNGSLLHCRLKVRIFRSAELKQSEKLMVDFCRRSGDAVAFQRIFSRSVQHLLTEFNAADGSEAILPYLGETDDAPFQIHIVSDPAELTLVPLLEMLQGDASPAQLAQQAEAIAALAALASASTTSAVAVCAALEQLARPGILEACASSCRAEVAYPAACLTKTLRDQCGWVGA